MRRSWGSWQSWFVLLLGRFFDFGGFRYGDNHRLLFLVGLLKFGFDIAKVVDGDARDSFLLLFFDRHLR